MCCGDSNIICNAKLPPQSTQNIQMLLESKHSVRFNPIKESLDFRTGMQKIFLEQCQKYPIKYRVQTFINLFQATERTDET